MLNKVIEIASWLAGLISLYLDTQNKFHFEATILFILASSGLLYIYKVDKDKT